MTKIGANDSWKKTLKFWQDICNEDDREMTDQCLEQLSKIASLNTTVVWKCVMSYIISPTDLRNLAATCRSLYTLVESELGWSYLIRTKFGYSLWFRYVRQIFYQENNQSIDLHEDIEIMNNIELAQECTTIPATFFINDAKEQSMAVSRAILRSYRYHLETYISKHIIYIFPTKYLFRHLVLFKNIYSEYLNDAQRRTVPLTKLIYFYLADQRHHLVINFSSIYPRENVKQISDSEASAGSALQLNTRGKMIVMHSYHSIMPGRYEIFWRLRFTSSPVANDNLEFIAVPKYGLMTREHTSSEQFATCLTKYGNSYFRRSMGVITVFKRCTVFVGCIDLTRWQPRTSFALDYVELIAVV